MWKKQGQQGRWSSSAIKRGQNPHHALSLKCFEKTLKTCAHPAYEVLQTSMLNMMSLYLHAFSRRPYWCFLGGDLPFYGFSSLSLDLVPPVNINWQILAYQLDVISIHFADQKPTTSSKKQCSLLDQWAFIKITRKEETMFDQIDRKNTAMFPQ